MTTRAQDLIAEATFVSGITYRCSRGHLRGQCATCDGISEYARDLARTALLATLRKQHLRLAYFEPDAERRALREQLRIALDNGA